MPRLTPSPTRLNHTIQQSGKEYNYRLLQRGQAILNSLLLALPSTYLSTIQGPNYTIELKAVAAELARLELALEDVSDDQTVATVRSDFLYATIGYLIFLNGKLPKKSFSDEEFRKFLINLIRIYYQGSIPKSITELARLLISDDVIVRENFLLVRQNASGLDISDQWGFSIDVPIQGPVPEDLFDTESTLRLIADVIRPAHTLFRLRYIFTDTYTPNPDDGGTILDQMSWRMSVYHYEDVRRYWGGVAKLNFY
jgi:hypothetical protein